MKDPIQGALDAVREVEIRVGQIRLLWAEAERAKEAAEAEVKSLRARKDEDVERFRARAKQDRRDRFECGESLKAAHAAIWGLVCVATNMLHSAESATRDLKRLRRSNEQVREVLGANHDESPVEAAERAVAERQNKEYMGREIERLRAERDKERTDWSRLLQDERSALHTTIVGLRSDLENAQGRYERMTEESLDRVVKLEKSCRDGEQEVQALQESWSAVRAERDKALARVEELERLVPVEGGVRPMNACCYSARQVARNECASALFRILRPTKEPPQQGTYVFNTALVEIIEEINALRKDRETLYRVRSAVGEKP